MSSNRWQKHREQQRYPELYVLRFLLLSASFMSIIISNMQGTYYLYKQKECKPVYNYEASTAFLQVEFHPAWASLYKLRASAPHVRRTLARYVRSVSTSCTKYQYDNRRVEWVAISRKKKIASTIGFADKEDFNHKIRIFQTINAYLYTADITFPYEDEGKEIILRIGTVITLKWNNNIIRRRNDSLS